VRLSLQDLEARMLRALRRSDKPYTKKHWLARRTTKGYYLLKGVRRYNKLAGTDTCTFEMVFVPYMAGTDPLRGD